MAITLEGIDITGLVRVAEFQVEVEGESQRANDGSIIVYEQEVYGGDFTLGGGDNWGWLTFDTLTSLKALANVVGGTYTLDYEGSIHIVRFRSEDIPVISGDPLIVRSNVENGDYYNNIVLKLMEV